MKVGGQIPWNATPICETSQIYYLMGRRPMKPMKDVLVGLVLWSVTVTCENVQDLLADEKTLYEMQFEEPCEGPVIPGSMNMVRKFYLEYSLACAENLERRLVVADIEEPENLDPSGIRARRLNSKEVRTPKNGERFIFRIADGIVKLSGRDHGFRESTSMRNQPARNK